ncbi:MAG: tRNA uridine-5-carboxymethylaminomethyl(34) synthesis GTPase MnmE [Rhodopseudomonas sp.]|nr:tRNA uridine-5-carboxymethylaminomethyl(34) synthesis GTPase MnmE [Rhodopseudomonas sp.]
MTDRPTIFALSSGRPPVAIAVIRISGLRAGAALTALGIKVPEPRQARFARIRDPRSGEIIDEGLVLWFAGPRSETGEDVAELQVHGGRAVIAAVLDALASIDGLRMAEPGEFTRRGFENGKLDLTAVEGLADLVGAETEGQRRQAMRQMAGLLGNRAEAWRRDLIKALALVEARIDFSDEGDVPEDLVTPSLTIVRELRGEIAAALADGHRGERLREGLVVAIAGPPNAGKSTLLNRIARREVAIVSPHAGTTRDVIEVHLDLGGLPVTLLDTAGIRETDDPVELEGVRRARQRAADADLVLWVSDASVQEMVSDVNALEAGQGSRPDIWRVRNKIDLVSGVSDSSESIIQRINPGRGRDVVNITLSNVVNHQLTERNESGLHFNNALEDVANRPSTDGLVDDSDAIGSEFLISATSGAGFDALLAALASHAESHLAGGEQSLVTRARHRRALEETVASLESALSGDLAGREDLLAEELRAAAAALGRLTGRVDIEDVLDVIFRDFCIGK